jgi:hypothetical protein
LIVKTHLYPLSFYDDKRKEGAEKNYDTYEPGQWSAAAAPQQIHLNEFNSLQAKAKTGKAFYPRRGNRHRSTEKTQTDQPSGDCRWPLTYRIVYGWTLRLTSAIRAAVSSNIADWHILNDTGQPAFLPD